MVFGTIDLCFKISALINERKLLHAISSLTNNVYKKYFSRSLILNTPL